MEDVTSKNKQSKMVTNFGERKISNQNFSKVIALPKTALQNCGIVEKLSVELVQEGENKFLKLSPVGGKPNE
jgi:hypothetical protein